MIDSNIGPAVLHCNEDKYELAFYIRYVLSHQYSRKLLNFHVSDSLIYFSFVIEPPFDYTNIRYLHTTNSKIIVNTVSGLVFALSVNADQVLQWRQFDVNANIVKVWKLFDIMLNNTFLLSDVGTLYCYNNDELYSLIENHDIIDVSPENNLFLSGSGTLYSYQLDHIIGIGNPEIKPPVAINATILGGGSCGKITSIHYKYHHFVVVNDKHEIFMTINPQFCHDTLKFHKIFLWSDTPIIHYVMSGYNIFAIDVENTIYQQFLLATAYTNKTTNLIPPYQQFVAMTNDPVFAIETTGGKIYYCDTDANGTIIEFTIEKPILSGKFTKNASSCIQKI